jgi:hypothetical protein
VKEIESNKILDWFKKEGALKQDGNLYIATHAFVANSVVIWVKNQSKNLKQKEIEYIMNMLRLFLKKKVGLTWKDNKIEIIKKTNSEESDSPKKQTETKEINELFKR